MHKTLTVKEQWAQSSRLIHSVVLFLVLGMILTFLWKLPFCFDILPIDLLLVSPIIIHFVKLFFASPCCKRSVQVFIWFNFCWTMRSWILWRHATYPDFHSKLWNMILQIFLHPLSIRMQNNGHLPKNLDHCYKCYWLTKCPSLNAVFNKS
jgi:hypothetical protein